MKCLIDQMRLQNDRKMGQVYTFLFPHDPGGAIMPVR